MQPTEGWIIENLDGVCYRLLINSGHYLGIVVALRLYNGPWYAIRTTGLTGTEKEIIDSVTDDNRVTVDAKWERNDLLHLQVIDKEGNVLFTNKDTRVFQKRVYKY
jgi:hypothetical protein